MVLELQEDCMNTRQVLNFSLSQPLTDQYTGAVSATRDHSLVFPSKRDRLLVKHGWQCVYDSACVCMCASHTPVLTETHQKLPQGIDCAVVGTLLPSRQNEGRNRYMQRRGENNTWAIYSGTETERMLSQQEVWRTQSFRRPESTTDIKYCAPVNCLYSQMHSLK